MSENAISENLRRLMVEGNFTIGDVVAATGLDRRTLQGILEGNTRAHARTLHRLAKGLDVAVDEFFVSPSQLLCRRFNRETNPGVEEAVAAEPGLFEGWTELDFDELRSRFGAGGELTLEGAVEAARQMNRNHRLHDMLAFLLETNQSDVIAGILEVMYEKAVFWGGDGDASD